MEQSPSSEAKLFSPCERVPELYRTRTFITVIIQTKTRYKVRTLK